MQRQPLKPDEGVQRTRTVDTVDPSKVEKKTQTAPSGGNKCGKCGGNHPTKSCNKQPANPKLGASKPPVKKTNAFPKGGNAAKNAKIIKRTSGRRGN